MWYVLQKTKISAIQSAVKYSHSKLGPGHDIILPFCPLHLYTAVTFQQDHSGPVIALVDAVATVMRCSLGVNVQEKNRARLVLKALWKLCLDCVWQFKIWKLYFFVLHPEKIGCVGCISIILQVKIDVKKAQKNLWGGVILNLLIAPQISETKIALIILLSILGFIDQPYKSKTYPMQPSKKNTCQ